MKINFLDLDRQYQEIKPEIDQAVKRVIDRQYFILGEELINFEKKFAGFLGAKYTIGLNSGTDALVLGLKALGIGAGDEVITSPFSFIATTLAITETGATPVFVDINPATYQIDETKIEAAITDKTKAILPVHIYGSPCQIDKIMEIAQKHNLRVVEDACQAHGATLNGKKVGTFGDLGTYSFYPGKNLGAYGDGGGIATDSLKLYDKLVMMRNYGQKVKYYHDEIGINSRLDEIQAAVLSIKLDYLEKWNKRRQEIALAYREGLRGYKFQKMAAGGVSCYHVFVIENEDRDGLMKYLSENGVQTLIHYPVPIHLQKCYKELGFEAGSFPNAEKACGRIVSLPIYSEMTDQEVNEVISLINKFDH